MERHFHPCLFSNDDDAATDHCPVKNLFANGEEIFSRALDGFDRQFAARGRSKAIALVSPFSTAISWEHVSGLTIEIWLYLTEFALPP